MVCECVVAVILAFAASSGAEGPPDSQGIGEPPPRVIEMGFLEEAYMPPLYPGVEQVRETHVRVAFRYEDGAWAAFVYPMSPKEPNELRQAFPKARLWTAFYRGQVKGKVTSRNLENYTHRSDVGIHKIAGYTDQLECDSRTMTFTIGNLQEPGYRPLVLLSGSIHHDVEDPEGWHRVERNFPIPQGVFDTIMGVTAGRTEADFSGIYNDREMELAKSFESKNGAKLLVLRFRDNTGISRADGVRGTYWVALPVDGQAHYIGNGLRLVDSGDFDGDGATEFVFLAGWPDYNGYILAWDCLRRSTNFVCPCR